MDSHSLVPPPHHVGLWVPGIGEWEIKTNLNREESLNSLLPFALPAQLHQLPSSLQCSIHPRGPPHSRMESIINIIEWLRLERALKIIELHPFAVNKVASYQTKLPSAHPILPWIAPGMVHLQLYGQNIIWNCPKTKWTLEASICTQRGGFWALGFKLDD